MQEIINSGSLSQHTLIVEEEETVKDLLKKINLENKYFAIIVNGKRAEPDTILKAGYEVIILPKIAGG